MLIETIFSLVIYGLFLIPALFCFYMSEIKLAENDEKKYYIFILIGVAIVCLLAGLRSSEVGTDVQVYAEKIYHVGTEMHSWSQVMNINIEIEKVYVILAYIVSHIFHDFGVFLFVLEMLIVIPILIVAVKDRKRVSVFCVMTAFLCLFYPMTFNIMRQSIAAAFLVLALYYFMEKKQIKTIFLVLVAICFHSSTILGVVLLAGVWVISSIKNKKTKIRLLIGLFIMVAIVVLFWKNIAYWLIYEVKLFPSNYTAYYEIFANKKFDASREYYFEIGGYGIADLLFRLITPFVLYYASSKQCNVDEKIRLYRHISFASTAIYVSILLALGTVYGYRFVLFLDFVNIFYFAEVLRERKISFDIRNNVIDTLIYLYLLAYFGGIYFVMRAHESVPYILR